MMNFPLRMMKFVSLGGFDEAAEAGGGSSPRQQAELLLGLM